MFWLSVGVFFVLSYALSWVGWLGAGVWWTQGSVFYFIGGYGPALAALITAGIFSGKEGLTDLLRRLFTWRVPVKWYAAAFFIPPFAALLLIGIAALVGILGPDQRPLAYWLQDFPSLLPGMALITVAGVFVSAGEEIGWRGFAQPTLEKRLNPLAATLIVGVLWGLWHLPFQWGGQMPPRDMVFFTLGTTSISVIYTWLIHHGQGSILLACILHASYDVVAIFTPQFVPFTSTWSFGIGMLILTIIALVIVLLDRSTFLPDGFRLARPQVTSVKKVT